MSWLVTITVKDRKSKSSSFSLNFDSAQTLAQVEGFITGISLPLGSLIRGAITAINITKKMTVPLAMQGVAEDDSDVEEGMRVQMRSMTNFLSHFRLPTIDEGALVPNSTVADETDPNVILLKTALEDGVNVSGTLVHPTDNRGDEIATVESINGVFSSSTGSR